MYLLFIDYLQNVHRKVQCRQFETHVFVMRTWVVGRGKHFTQYSAHSCGNTRKQCIRSEVFSHSCENRDTGHGTRLTGWIISRV